MKALAKDPADRYQTAAEMAAGPRARSDRAADRRGAPSASPVPPPPAGRDRRRSPAWTRPSRSRPVDPGRLRRRTSRRSRIAWYVLLGDRVVAVLAVAAWLARQRLRRGRRHQGRASPTSPGSPRRIAEVRLAAGGADARPDDQHPGRADDAQGHGHRAGPGPAGGGRPGTPPSPSPCPAVPARSPSRRRRPHPVDGRPTALQDAGLTLGAGHQGRRPRRGQGQVIDSNPQTGTAVDAGHHGLPRRVLRHGEGARRHWTAARRRPRPTSATPASRSSSHPQEDATRRRARSSRTNPAGGTELARGKTVTIV